MRNHADVFSGTGFNRDWQLLNFALERRERVTPYQTPAPPKANPFSNRTALLAQLRYAAGV